MTAYSKAQKLAQKRGRKRMEAALREPNGRLSRRVESRGDRQSMSEREARHVAVDRRVRQLGVSEEQAIDPKRGYVLGLLYLDGKITLEQHETGIAYAKAMARYHGLTGVPFPSARAQDLFAVRGEAGETEEKLDAAKQARARAKRMEAILLATGDINTGRRIESTVKNVCLLDIEGARMWPAHMLDYLRRGLNALGNVYE